MPRRSRPPRPRPRRAAATSRATIGLRIIGGKYRRRKLVYSGDPATRPMKDRVREALFNLLGPAVRGKHALDLFAGTGALGLEAISRGAARTTLVERRAAAAERIRRNLKEIGVQEPCQVIPADAFSWFPAFCSAAPAGGEPWVVFLSPPYDYYSQREADMLALIARAVGCSPRGSMVVVECDERFDLSRLPQAGRWDVRQYPPTVLAIWRNEGVEPVPRQ